MRLVGTYRSDVVAEDGWTMQTMTWPLLTPEQAMDLVPVRPPREDEAFIQKMSRTPLPETEGLNHVDVHAVLMRGTAA